MDLLYGIKTLAEDSLVLSQLTRLTDRRTDRQTDILLMAKIALHKYGTVKIVMCGGGNHIH